MCGTKDCDVKIPRESALDFLNRNVDSMIYCYVCGEELSKEEECLMCIDGCGLKISEQATCSKDQGDTGESDLGDQTQEVRQLVDMVAATLNLAQFEDRYDHLCNTGVCQFTPV